MTVRVEPPATAARPGGSFGFDLFQTAYVTNDLDHAAGIFAERHGIRNWTRFEPGGGMRIALAWVNGHQIELIQATGTGIPIYTEWLAEGGGFAIRLHHFGYFIHDDQQWAEMEQLLEREKRPVIFGGDGGIARFAYVDAPELGHYIEYVYPNADGRAFFESVAAN